MKRVLYKINILNSLYRNSSILFENQTLIHHQFVTLDTVAKRKISKHGKDNRRYENYCRDDDQSQVALRGAPQSE